MCYQTEKKCAKDFDKADEAMDKELKKKIDSQDYVSAAADTWSVSSKSLMGVTVHWIDTGNYLLSVFVWLYILSIKTLLFGPNQNINRL